MRSGNRYRITWKFVGTTLIIVVVAAALLANARAGIRDTDFLTAPADVAAWNLDNAYFSCLDAQVKSVIPRGERVWVDDVNPRNGPVWSETLAKVVGAYTPMTIRPGGVVNVFLVDTHGGCLGVRVKAVAPDGAAVRFGSGSLKSTTQLPNPP